VLAILKFYKETKKCKKKMGKLFGFTLPKRPKMASKRAYPITGPQIYIFGEKTFLFPRKE